MNAIINPLKRLKILVAEDNEVNQRVLRAILERAGYNCDYAKDGKEAVERYPGGNYDVILMDCQMPFLDGLQATSEIRNLEVQSKLNRCPIVALTANAMKGDRERCLNVGMDDFISKPFKSQDLLAKIQNWTEGSSS